VGPLFAFGRLLACAVRPDRRRWSEIIGAYAPDSCPTSDEPPPAVLGEKPEPQAHRQTSSRQPWPAGPPLLVRLATNETGDPCAIQRNSLPWLACFSVASTSRPQGCHYKELNLAAEYAEDDSRVDQFGSFRLASMTAKSLKVISPERLPQRRLQPHSAHGPSCTFWGSLPPGGGGCRQTLRSQDVSWHGQRNGEE
jgi:hypothetical protein